MTENDTSGGGAAVLDNSASSGSGANTSLDTGGQGQPSPQEWDNLPKSWTKDLEGDWRSAPENVRKFVHRRETDVEKGIRTYADGHSRWQKVTQPFQEVFQQQPDLDPTELFANLAHNHLALVRAEPAARREMFLRMAQHYGIDFAQAAAGQQGAQAAASGAQDDLSPKQVAAIRNLLGPLVDSLRGVQSHINTQREAAAKSDVDKFFSDPENEFVNEVGPLMAQILTSGQTRILKEAYELAIMRTPEVKAKYLDSLATKAGSAGQPSGGKNVKSSSASASTSTPRTIDETMGAIVAKHYGTKR